jgi:hypothetical protein
MRKEVCCRCVLAPTKSSLMSTLVKAVRLYKFQCLGAFEDTIVSLSLGSACVMNFTQLTDPPTHTTSYWSVVVWFVLQMPLVF